MLRREGGDTEVIFTDENGEIIVDEDGAPITDREAAAERAGVDLSEEAAAEQEGVGDALAKPGEGVWANYDFVPGDRIIFYEDYESERVGNFPRRLEFKNGNWEVVEWEGRRLLRSVERGGAFNIPLSETLPERFTLEFDVYWSHGNQILWITPDSDDLDPDPGRYRDASRLVVAEGGTGVETMNADRSKSVTRVRGTIVNGITPIRVMADGSYIKVYVGEQRVANMPNAIFPRTEALQFFSGGSTSPENPAYIGPIRIAESTMSLYDALVEEGRVATQGILFDLDSDVIRPESTPTLQEIGEMLTNHADLRIAIEGHTDSSGDDAHNLELSDRRANAVRRFLIEAYGIDDGRLEAQGFGESDPIDVNDTPEGRQNNRRVELVQLDG